MPEANQSLIQSLASLIPFFGQFVKDIPLIGNLFRGSTQHVDYNTAIKKSNVFAGRFIAVYDQLPDDGKVLMHANCKKFYQWVKDNFGNWWDNAINLDFETWQNLGWLNDNRTATYHYMERPVYYFTRFPDVDGELQDHWNDRFAIPFQQTVLTPLSDYVKNTYGISLEDFIEKSNPPPQPSGAPFFAGFKGVWVWVAIAGVLGAIIYFSFIKK